MLVWQVCTTFFMGYLYTNKNLITHYFNLIQRLFITLYYNKQGIAIVRTLELYSGVTQDATRIFNTNGILNCSDT